MRKFFVILGILMCVSVWAEPVSIDWYIDGQNYVQTTCNPGDTIMPPNAPIKYGYTFKKWYNMYFGTIVTTSTSANRAVVTLYHDNEQIEVDHNIAQKTPTNIDNILEIAYPGVWQVKNISPFKIKIGSNVINPKGVFRWNYTNIINYEIYIIDL